MSNQSINIISSNGYSILLNPDNLAWVKVKNEVLETLMNNKVLSKDFMYLLSNKYHFFERTPYNPQYISTVYFSITNRCNMNCKFCTLNSSPEFNVQNDMSLDLIRSTIPKIIKGFNPSSIVITGGEPTMRADLIDILDICQEYRRDCSIMLQTNGLSLNEYNVDKLIPRLDIIEISIEHMIETNHMIRLHKVLKTLQESDIDIRLSFVIDNNTKNIVTSAIDLCYQYDAIFEFRFVAAVGRATASDILLADKDIKNIYLHMAKHLLDKHFFSPKLTHAIFGSLNTRKSCGAWGKTLGINYDGKVQMCGNLEGSIFNYGHLNIDDIDNLKDKIKLKLQDENLQYKFSVENVSICSNCIGKYFCGGACVAELENIGNEMFRCETKRLYILYLMFYYKKNYSVEENLINLITFLNESNNKIFDDVTIYSTSFDKLCNL